MQRTATPVARLVGKAGGGDQRAWDELVGRYAGLVWSVARTHRLSEADAADVSQATWLRLAEHLGTIEEPEALGGWLATTARRECLRILRHHDRVLPCADAPEPPGEQPGVDARLLAGERDRRLWGAFSRLSDRDQAMLRLLVADPAPSYHEVGAALGMPIGSIGPTRARALERLRGELKRA